MKTRYLSLAVALACSGQAALADTAPTDSSIEHVVVSSRVAVPYREVATSVSVMTAEDIANVGLFNLSEVLETQPSIYVNKSGSVGSTTSLRIRGEEGFRTLVRIDGIDISDPTGTQIQPQLAHFLSTNVSRVEILRGTQGLAYGADAGGVINVQTGRHQAGTFGSVQAEAGQFDTRNLAAEVGGDYDKANFYVSAVDFSTDGFNSLVSDTSKDDDGYDNTTVHARFGYNITDEISFSLVGRTTEGEGEFDNCGFGDTASNDCSSSFNQDNLRTSLSYDGEWGNHSIAYAKTLVERENFNQGASSYFTKGETERVEYLGNTAVNTQTQLVYGFDWESQAITSEQQSRIEKGYYVEVQGEWADNWYTTAGLRYDDNEDFGHHTSYRISSAYIWALANGELKLRGALGTGFRAPSIYEIEYNRGPWAYEPASSTALQEEKSRGYEVGLQYTANQGSSIEVVYFDQEVENAIEYDMATYSGYLQDIGTSYSDGIEVIGDWHVTDSFSVVTNYTYNDTEDTEGEQRSRRPKHLLNLGVNYRLERLNVSANLRVVRDFVDNGTQMDDYQLVNISARYAVTDALTVFGRVENALDEDYRDISNYNTAGSAAYAGVKYQF